MMHPGDRGQESGVRSSLQPPAVFVVELFHPHGGLWQQVGADRSFRAVRTARRFARRKRTPWIADLIERAVGTDCHSAQHVGKNGRLPGRPARVLRIGAFDCRPHDLAALRIDKWVAPAGGARNFCAPSLER